MLRKSTQQHTMAWLDLAACQRNDIPIEKQISLLIQSLKENYFAYGMMIARKQKERQLRIRSDYYTKSGFFAIPRIAIPEMKADSKYIIWRQFIRKTFEFFDGNNREAFVHQLLALENKLLALHNKLQDPASIEALLEKLLDRFEAAAGFLPAVTITFQDGKNGILSTDEFNHILRSGHTMRDVGAGPQHGLLSHRLQFYILAQYFHKHVTEFFTEQDLKILGLPATKIISAFYRLLGTNEFNDSFDWVEFRRKRRDLNQQCNEQDVPDELNADNIWAQLFDRYGYAGYFSVPSSFGLLQKLGCFSSLPQLGAPRVDTNRHIKTILDVTPKMRP